MQSSEATTNVAGFVGKLWKMVNDPLVNDMICWNETGDCFVIKNESKFWSKLLPLYYKHANMSSFIRQLNFYGFHKVSLLESGTKGVDNITFYHPSFQRGRPDLLKDIKRKVSVKQETGTTDIDDSLSKVILDVKKIRTRQSDVDQQLEALKEENAILWTELAMLRQRHIKQQKVINRIINFLVNLMQQKVTGNVANIPVSGMKRKNQVMIKEIPFKKPKTTVGEQSNQNEAGSSSKQIFIQELNDETENKTGDKNSENIVKIKTESGDITTTKNDEGRSLESHLVEYTPNLSNRVSAAQDYSNLLGMLRDEFGILKSTDYSSPSNNNILNTPTADTLADSASTSGATGEKAITPYNSQNSLVDVSLLDSILFGNKGMWDNIPVSESHDSPGPSSHTIETSPQLVQEEMSKINKPEDLNNHLETTQIQLDHLKNALNEYSLLDDWSILSDEKANQNMSNLPTSESDPLVTADLNSLENLNILFDNSLDVQDDEQNLLRK